MQRVAIAERILHSVTYHNRKSPSWNNFCKNRMERVLPFRFSYRFLHICMKTIDDGKEGEEGEKEESNQGQAVNKLSSVSARTNWLFSVGNMELLIYECFQKIYCFR